MMTEVLGTVDMASIEPDMLTSLVVNESADAKDVRRCRVHQSEYVLKVLKEERLDCVDWVAMDMLIAFVAGLDITGGNPRDLLLWESCAWTVAIVEEQGRPVGFLQRSHVSGGRWGEPRSQWPSLARIHIPETMKQTRNEYYFAKPSKLARLGDLIMIVAALHDCGLTVGDLKGKNALTSPPDQHYVPNGKRVYLLDTDSFHIGGRTPFNNAPPGEPIVHDPGTKEGDGELLGRLIMYALVESTQINESQFRHAALPYLPEEHIERIILMARGKGRGVTSMRNLAVQWSSLEGRDGSLYTLKSGSPELIGEAPSRLLSLEPLSISVLPTLPPFTMNLSKDADVPTIPEPVQTPVQKLSQGNLASAIIVALISVLLSIAVGATSAGVMWILLVLMSGVSAAVWTARDWLRSLYKRMQ